MKFSMPEMHMIVRTCASANATEAEQLFLSDMAGVAANRAVTPDDYLQSRALVGLAFIGNGYANKRTRMTLRFIPTVSLPESRPIRTEI